MSHGTRPGRNWEKPPTEVQLACRRHPSSRVPEPLQFVLNDGVRVMLIPTGGFDWITGDHDVAPRGTSECVLSLSAETDTEVDATVRRAHDAGAAIVTEPGRQPWGYAGAFADPDGHLWMVTSDPAH
jgi:uncharacterized protein